jgi:hypothetical protein
MASKEAQWDAARAELREQRPRTLGELRREIVDMVGSDAEGRYHAGCDRAFRKQDLTAIADALGICWRNEDAGATVVELYRMICDVVGLEYHQNAGKPWKLRKAVIEAVYDDLVETLDDEQPHRVVCAECGELARYHEGTQWRTTRRRAKQAIGGFKATHDADLWVEPVTANTQFEEDGS